MTEWKRKNYKFWHSPIALISLFCVVVFFGYKMIDLIETERETSNKKELILDQINNLKDRENSLNNDILKLNTEEGREEVIREKYQVAKKGEKMVIIVDEESREDLVNDGRKNGHGFWNWVKGIFKK